MEINLDGIVSDLGRYKYAVKQNNKSNIIIFKFEKEQDSIILNPNKNFYVKIRNSGRTFSDKDPNVVITYDNKYIMVAWTMLRKATQFKNIDIQLQYEDLQNDIVWQSAIINVDLFDTIPADKDIEDKYPSILMSLQQQIDEIRSIQSPIEIVDELPELFVDTDLKKIYRTNDTDYLGNPIVSSTIMIDKEVRSERETISIVESIRNGVQLDNETLLQNFDDYIYDILGEDYNVDNVAQVYTVYLATDPITKALRLGTSKNVGSFEITSSELSNKSIKLILGKYFSYNTITGEKIFDENANAELENEYGGVIEELSEVPKEYELEIGPSGWFKIANSSGRIHIYGISSVLDEKTIYTPKEIAKKEDVDALDRYILEEIYPEIGANSRDIAQLQTDVLDISLDIQETKERIGDIQIFNANRLPTPGFEYINKILKVDGKLYHCIQKGEAFEKRYSFENVVGSSEITSSNWNNFAREVTNNFNQDIQLINNEIYKLFRNDGTIKMGSSSNTSHFRIGKSDSISLPITNIVLEAKTWNNTKNALLNIDIWDSDQQEEINEQWELEASSDIQIKNIECDESMNLSSIFFENEKIDNTYDNRLILIAITIKFGNTEYEWKEIGSGGDIKVVDLGYEESGTLTQEQLDILLENKRNLIKHGNYYLSRDYESDDDLLYYSVNEGSFSKVIEISIFSNGWTNSNIDLVNQDGLTAETTARETADAEINAKIPSQASPTNQLADKNFVNSSVATNTAYFKGTYDIVADLGLTQSATHEQVAQALYDEDLQPTNNDYCYVYFTNETTGLVERYDRYKYNADDDEWSFEYTLNNSSFTAQQWASINSGITAQQVLLLNDIEDRVFNKINASEIVGSALTIEQYGIATNGKPTIIKGSFQGKDNIILLSIYSYSPSAYIGWAIYGNVLTEFTLQKNTRTLQIDQDKLLYLNKVYIFNGKVIPENPTDLTKQYLLSQDKTTGNLSFQAIDEQTMQFDLMDGTTTTKDFITK